MTTIYHFAYFATGTIMMRNSRATLKKDVKKLQKQNYLQGKDTRVWFKNGSSECRHAMFKDCH